MADYTGVVYQEISVDVSEPNQFAPILVAQGDAYTRGLKITMTQHGEKLNIPNTGVTAALNACNMADNTKKASVMAEISSDGTITAIIPSVVMEAAGYVQCDVSVIGSDGSNTAILKSTVFYLNCEASADTDGSSQPPEDDVITAAIASIAGKVDSSVYNQKIGEIEDEISAIMPDETIYDDTAYDNPNAPANNNHLMVFFGTASGTNISLGLPPLTSADYGTVFHFEISFIQANMSKVWLQENEPGTIKTYAEYTPITSGETIEFDYTMTSADVTNLRMRMYERAGAQKVSVKITKKYISVKDYAYSKSEVYNKTEIDTALEEIDDTLTDKADYVKSDNVNRCLDMGSIYKTVVQFGGEQLTAVLISCNDNVDHHLSQLAFTENGKLLFRAKTGTSWSNNDPFILLGGGS